MITAGRWGGGRLTGGFQPPLEVRDGVKGRGHEVTPRRCCNADPSLERGEWPQAGDSSVRPASPPPPREYARQPPGSGAQRHNWTRRRRRAGAVPPAAASPRSRALRKSGDEVKEPSDWAKKATQTLRPVRREAPEAPPSPSEFPRQCWDFPRRRTRGGADAGEELRKAGTSAKKLKNLKK